MGGEVDMAGNKVQTLVIHRLPSPDTFKQSLCFRVPDFENSPDLKTAIFFGEYRHTVPP